MRSFHMTGWEDGGVQVVQASGELDAGACASLRERVADAGRALLVVDLSGVTFLDSVAVTTLAELHMATRERGTSLAIIRPEGAADRIFALTGMDVHLPLYDERVPVLAQFNYG